MKFLKDPKQRPFIIALIIAIIMATVGRITEHYSIGILGLIIISVLFTIFIIKLYSRIFKKMKKNIKEEGRIYRDALAHEEEEVKNIQANGNTICGPFAGDLVYNVKGDFSRHLKVYTDKVELSFFNEIKTFWYSDLNAASLAANMGYEFEYSDGRPFIDRGKNNHNKEAYHIALDNGEFHRIRFWCTYEKAKEIVDFINGNIHAARIGNTRVATNQQQATPIQAAVHSSEILLNIKESPSSSFCDKCNEFADKLYTVTITRDNNSKSFDLCKNCALIVKKKIDEQNSHSTTDII